MDAERLQQIQGLFLEASELSVDDIDSFLQRECGSDAELLRDVMVLLRSSERAGRFDELAEKVGRSGADRIQRIPPPPQIGHYRIIREIGRGGMGTVYLAERADGQFEQQVAIKILRRDLDSEGSRDRFLSERQILAHVSHPHIARLLDGGVMEDGRPYFVMEHVDGVPIDAYCDERRMSVDERLGLFRTVCTAVQYAHRHLVIHRDLKPGNILVTREGAVKLLDFGIAKLLESDSHGSREPRTGTGTRMMTPEYASPEHIRGDPVTTAGDVYQLGVLLFELLTGHRPHSFSDRALYELERVITEEEPTRPSVAVTWTKERGRQAPTHKVTADSVSHARATTVDRLRRRLSGDLDNIVLMALRKEPARRYGSVDLMEEDLRRHLEGLPVKARPDTFGYRTGKFLSRHTLGAAAAGLAIIVLIAFAAAMGVQAERTARERDKAERVTAFLVDLIESSDPGVALGDTLTVREVLDRGAERVRDEIADQPEVQAEIMRAVGGAYRGLGLMEQAETQWAAALEVRQRTLGEDHPDVAQSLHDLGILQAEQGRLEEAEPNLRAAVSLYRRAGKEERGGLGKSLNGLGYLLQVKGEHDDAIAAYQQALDAYRSAPNDERVGMVATMMNLGWIEENRGELDSAEAHFRGALATRRELFDAGHPLIGRSLSALATVLRREGRLEEAEQTSREALELRQRLYPNGHPELAESLLGLANILADHGQHAASDSLFESALGAFASAYGPEAPHVARVRNDFASRLMERGAYEQAEPLYRQALPVYLEVLGEEHPFPAIVRGNLASTLHALSQPEEAERLWRQAVATLRTASIDPQMATRPMLELGSFLGGVGRHAEAEPLLLEAHAMLEAGVGQDSEATREAVARLADLYRDWGRNAEADRYRAMMGDGPRERDPSAPDTLGSPPS